MIQFQESGDTIYTLAEYLDLSPSTISKYSNNLMAPKSVTIDAIANKYNVNPIWLMGATVDRYMEDNRKTKLIPVVGRIACGMPILAECNIESYECVDIDDDVMFCLMAKGDSMIGARICIVRIYPCI